MKQRVFRRMLCLLLAALLPACALAESADVFHEFDGTALELTPYEGKAIYISFFTSWCAYCMDEMPSAAAAYQAFSADELQILLVHVWDGEDSSVTTDLVAQYGLDGIPIIEDADLSLCGIVGLEGYPTNIFIDQSGYLYQYTWSLEDGELERSLDGMGVGRK